MQINNEQTQEKHDTNAYSSCWNVAFYIFICSLMRPWFSFHQPFKIFSYESKLFSQFNIYRKNFRNHLLLIYTWISICCCCCISSFSIKIMTLCTDLKNHWMMNVDYWYTVHKEASTIVLENIAHFVSHWNLFHRASSRIVCGMGIIVSVIANCSRCYEKWHQQQQQQEQRKSFGWWGKLLFHRTVTCTNWKCTAPERIVKRNCTWKKGNIHTQWMTNGNAVQFAWLFVCICICNYFSFDYAQIDING